MRLAIAEPSRPLKAGNKPGIQSLVRGYFHVSPSQLRVK